MENATKQLEKDFRKLIKEDNLSHAYLFFGGSAGSETDQCEKFAFAESLVNFLENGKFEKSEKQLTEILVIGNPDESIGIDEARTIKNFLYQKPVNSKYRTVIIRDAQNLTTEAQNSILKIVEEPPESALIIFIANNEETLLTAVVSRLQKIYFPAIGSHEKLKKIKLDESAFTDMSDSEIDSVFESLINDLRKDPIKNCQALKEALKRLTVIKQFNTNKKLQVKTLKNFLSK